MRPILVDVSDIFYFFCLGEGRGSPGRQGGGGGSLKIPGGAGVFQEGAGRGEGAGRASAGNLGGGGLNFFFHGRNAHQVIALKTPTSLNKEVRPFFLCDNSIWSFPSVSFLSDYSIFGGSEGYFILAIIASGAFELIVPDCYYRLGKMESKGSRLLI